MTPDSPYEEPEDFDLFWSEALAEANSAPLDLSRSHRRDRDHPSNVIETIRFRGADGSARHGWIAAPEGARRLPAFLWIPPYGRWSMEPNEYGTRAGMVSLSFNLHGESAFHEEAYRPERGYFADGMEEPRTWIFRRIFLDLVIALRLLRAQVEVDEGRIATMGMSQGAGLAIALGAWSRIVRAVCADMPFLSDVGRTLLSGVLRYPLKEIRDRMDALPLGEPRLLHTISYYDTRFQAARCAVPTQLSLGRRDPACRPATVEASFAALPGPKRLIQYDWGHDWHPDMVPNNAEWLTRGFA